MPNYDYNNNASATPPNSTVNDDTTNMNILNQEFTRSLGIVDNYASYPPVNKSNASRNNFQEDQAPLSSTPPSLTSSGYRAPSSSPIVFENSFLNTSPVGLSSGLNPMWFLEDRLIGLNKCINSLTRRIIWWSTKCKRSWQ